MTKVIAVVLAAAAAVAAPGLALAQTVEIIRCEPLPPNRAPGFNLQCPITSPVRSVEECRCPVGFVAVSQNRPAAFTTAVTDRLNDRNDGRGNLSTGSPN